MNIEDRIKSGDKELLITKYAPDTNMELHRDACSKLSIIIQGEVKETVKGYSCYAGFGDVVIKPKEVKHATQFGPSGAKILSILDIDKHMGRLNGTAQFEKWSWFTNTRVNLAAMDVIKSSRMNSEDLDESILNLLYLTGGNSIIGDNNAPPDWLKRIKERVNDEFLNSLKISDLAAEEGIHPVYMTHLFKKYYGLSITTYKRLKRVEAAIGKINSTEISFTEIALECGFYDQSHMCRDFQLVLGHTPGNMR